LITVYVYIKLLQDNSHCKERNYISVYCVKYPSHWWISHSQYHGSGGQ